MPETRGTASLSKAPGRDITSLQRQHGMARGATTGCPLGPGLAELLLRTVLPEHDAYTSRRMQVVSGRSRDKHQAAIRSRTGTLRGCGDWSLLGVDLHASR